MDDRWAAEQIFLAGVSSVLPDRIIRKQVKLSGCHLKIGAHSFELEDYENIYVIGAGKATALMAKEMEAVLGDKIKDGQVIVKHGSAAPLQFIKLTEAGHPVPDSNGFRATKELVKLASGTTAKDLVICLLSGGGSALLIDAPEGCTPGDVKETYDQLVRCGASIHEINTVRKHLSEIKGGGLAKKLFPSTVVTLVLSDVIGDSLEAIASGPAYPDSTTFEDALSVLKKYRLVDHLPFPVVHYLREGVEGIREETPKAGEASFDNVHHLLIGSNTLALEAAYQEALHMGLQPVILSDRIQGNCEAVASELLRTSLNYRAAHQGNSPLCLLLGGEPALQVGGNGLGGRNQHLALLFAFLIEGKPGITFLSAGTDGSDGPTSAAGAVVDGKTIPRARAQGLVPEKYLDNFDSFHFFEKAGGHIITGATGTNVMDLMVIIATDKFQVDPSD